MSVVFKQTRDRCGGSGEVILKYKFSNEWILLTADYCKYLDGKLSIVDWGIKREPQSWRQAPAFLFEFSVNDLILVLFVLFFHEVLRLYSHNLPFSRWPCLCLGVLSFSCSPSTGSSAVSNQLQNSVFMSGGIRCFAQGHFSREILPRWNTVAFSPAALMQVCRWDISKRWILGYE